MDGRRMDGHYLQQLMLLSVQKSSRSFIFSLFLAFFSLCFENVHGCYLLYPQTQEERLSGRNLLWSLITSSSGCHSSLAKCLTFQNYSRDPSKAAGGGEQFYFQVVSFIRILNTMKVVDFSTVFSLTVSDHYQC